MSSFLSISLGGLFYFLKIILYLAVLHLFAPELLLVAHLKGMIHGNDAV
jgi:hypothetical protein